MHAMSAMKRWRRQSLGRQHWYGAAYLVYYVRSAWVFARFLADRTAAAAAARSIISHWHDSVVSVYLYVTKCIVTTEKVSE